MTQGIYNHSKYTPEISPLLIYFYTFNCTPNFNSSIYCRQNKTYYFIKDENKTQTNGKM